MRGCVKTSTGTVLLFACRCTLRVRRSPIISTNQSPLKRPADQSQARDAATRARDPTCRLRLRPNIVSGSDLTESRIIRENTDIAGGFLIHYSRLIGNATIYQCIIQVECYFVAPFGVSNTPIDLC